MSTTTRKSSSSAKGASGGSNRLVLGLVGVAIIAFVGVVAFLSAGERADLPGLTDVAAPVVVDGEPITVPTPTRARTPRSVSRRRSSRRSTTRTVR
jgi:hypothetical protein